MQRGLDGGSEAYIQYVMVSVLRSLLITTLKKSAQPSDRRRSAYKIILAPSVSSLTPVTHPCEKELLTW